MNDLMMERGGKREKEIYDVATGDRIEVELITRNREEGLFHQFYFYHKCLFLDNKLSPPKNKKQKTKEYKRINERIF